MTKLILSSDTMYLTELSRRPFYQEPEHHNA